MAEQNRAQIDAKRRAKREARRKAIIRGYPKQFPDYNPKVGLAICYGIACGRYLQDLAKECGLPDRATVYGWVLDEPEFATAYARARELAAHSMADDLPRLADTATGENAQAVRLQVDTRKWVLSKMLPRVYGDKITADVTLTMTLESLVLKSLERQSVEDAKTIDHEAEDGTAPD